MTEIKQYLSPTRCLIMLIMLTINWFILSSDYFSKFSLPLYNEFKGTRLRI